MCFYDAYVVSLRKKVNKYFYKISSFCRSSHWRCSAKKMFLKILQYSQENTCVRVSLQAFRSVILLKRDTNLFSCEYCETFKNTNFEEYLRTTASCFMKKTRHSWRPNNSSKKYLNQGKYMGFQFPKHAYKEKFKENTRKCK